MSAVPYLEDADFTLYQGDALEVLHELPAESVQMCVTSPPYWGLRDYGTGSWEGGDAECDHLVREDARVESSTLGGGKATTGHQREGFKETCPRCGAHRVDNQLGLEPTLELYIARMVEVFREVKRVLRADGTCWLNIGDCYASQGDRVHGGFNGSSPEPQRVKGEKLGAPMNLKGSGIKPKDLAMMPARLALALQADGWYLRSQIVWSKLNPMPESVTDRPTSAYELVYLLAKQPRYYFDAEAVREPHDQPWRSNGKAEKNNWSVGGTAESRGSKATVREYNPAGRNLRNVWTIATEPFPEAHFATFPQALVERCIKAGTSERGCCPECGAGWVRETNTEYDWYRQPKERNFSATSGYMGKQGHARKQVETLGWRPDCECLTATAGGFIQNGTRPCTVLDPFIGSGTTALVARRLGRRCIGVELSEAYCSLAARRTQQLSLEAGAAG